MAANIGEAHHQANKQILEAALLLKEMDSSIDTNKLRQIIEERDGEISVDDLLAGEF